MILAIVAAASSAFSPGHLLPPSHTVTDRARAHAAIMAEPPVYSTATGLAVTEDKDKFTIERLAGMSSGMVQHIFEEVDLNGDGTICYEEMDMLAPYFSHFGQWTEEFKRDIFSKMDVDKGGSIDAEEFYEWMVHNAMLVPSEDGQARMKKRDTRLEVSQDSVPQVLMDILEETGAMGIEQRVTNPLHSGFGRSIGDHFVSCYLVLKEWGNDEDVCAAGLLHAAYQRGDGLQAVDASEMRPIWKEKLGERCEELVYLFPSAHKSAFASDGLLHAPLGSPITFPDVLQPGKTITIGPEMRAALAELEIINSHDQNFLCNTDPAQNLWSFYQHVTIMPLLTKGAAETVKSFQRKAFCAGATCDDIVRWHEGRFGGKLDEKWSKHVDMFRPGGRYYDIEKILLSFIDDDGFTGDGCDALPNYDGEGRYTGPPRRSD